MRLPNEAYVVGNKHEGYNSMQLQIVRFLSDQCAYRTQPSYGSEMILFGVIVLTAIMLLSGTMALAMRQNAAAPQAFTTANASTTSLRRSPQAC